MTRSSAIGDLLSLDGKVALVTGGAGGIGSAVVELLQAAGARVVSTDAPGKDRAPGVETIECDLGDLAAIPKLFASFRKQFNRLNLLIHCAGVTRDGVLWKMKDESWSDVMRVNLDSAFGLLREATPLMRETGGGSVVLVSSINGERGKFGQANYAASKAGLIGLGRTAALELGRFAIRVNIVSPGMIETPMTAQLPDEFRQQALDETPLGKLGQPTEVAAAVLYLCSSMSSHITGQVLRVDGGQLMA